MKKPEITVDYCPHRKEEAPDCENCDKYLFCNLVPISKEERLLRWELKGLHKAFKEVGLE